MIVAIILIDQLLKYYIGKTGFKYVILKNVFEITSTSNSGTLFGIASGNNLILAIISILIIIGLILLLKKSKKYSLSRFATKLIIAGGISNVIDRIFRGFVFDYILTGIFGVCNLADYAIVIGIVLLVIGEVRDLKEGR